MSFRPILAPVLLLAALLIGPAQAANLVWPPPPVLTQRGYTCTATALYAWAETGPAPWPAARLPSVDRLWHQALALMRYPPTAHGVPLAAGWRALVDDGIVEPNSARYTQDAATGLGWLRDGGIILEAPFYASEVRPYRAADGALALWGVWMYDHVVMCMGTVGGGRYIACQQSYGPAWNGDGRFLLRADDLATLLARGGQISTATAVRP